MKRTITLLFAAACMGCTAQAQNLPALLKDISASGNSLPNFFTPLGTNTLFIATDPVNGTELWVTDGTTAGTQLLKDINAGTGNSGINALYAANGMIYFNALDATNGNELWVTDGTPTGTQLLKDIDAGSGSSTPAYFTLYNGKVYFAATNEASGRELWVTDGTSAGTQMVKDIGPGTNYGLPANFIVYNNMLYFAADDGTNGDELWVTDGTGPGTQLVKDINPGSSSSGIAGFTIVNNKLFFSAGTAAAGQELWVTDGTSAGTQMVKDIDPGAGSSHVNSITAFNNMAFFSADDGTNGQELWVSDGTSGGTSLLKDIFPGGLGSGTPMNSASICVLNNKLYFGAFDNTADGQLWVTDGTSAGTVPVHTIMPLSANDEQPPLDLHVYHNKLYFQAKDNVNGWELWQSDGTDAGTSIIQPAIAPNNDPLGATPAPDGLVVSNGILYYSANYNASIGLEPYTLQTPDPAAAVNTVTKNIDATLYPNPATNTVQLQINRLQVQTTTISLIDITGRTLQQQTYELNTGDNKIQLNLKGIVPGNYFVRIQAGDDRQVMKLDVQ